MLFDHTEALLCGGNGKYSGLVKKDRRKHRKKSTKSVKTPKAVKDDTRPFEKVKQQPSGPLFSVDETYEQQSSSNDNETDMLKAERNIEKRGNTKSSTDDSRHKRKGTSEANQQVGESDEQSERERIEMLVARALAVHDSGIPSSTSEEQLEFDDTYNDVPVERKGPKPEDYMPVDISNKDSVSRGIPARSGSAPRPEDFFAGGGPLSPRKQTTPTTDPNKRPCKKGDRDRSGCCRRECHKSCC